jgi:hypothetical protein
MVIALLPPVSVLPAEAGNAGEVSALLTGNGFAGPI